MESSARSHWIAAGVAAAIAVVRLTHRETGEVLTSPVRKMMRASFCYLADDPLPETTELYEAVEGVVIAHGAITEKNRGPKIEASYRVSAVLRDDEQEVVTGAAYKGMCWVASE